MKKKEKSTFRKIEYHKKESFYLIVRGIEVGVFSGLVCVLYRYMLSFAENGMRFVMDYTKNSGIKTGIWFLILALIGVFVSFLIKWEPIIAGSGIPQINGEMKGHYNPVWWRAIIGKFAGGSAAVFGGLSLGREGPSVQLGGMAAKGVARLTKADKTTELRMISCGAGAGMSAAFNAPLAGVIYVLEEIHKSFDKSVLCMGIVATITADFVSKLFFGQSTIFNYDTVNFPLHHYWLLIIFGIITGACGVIYNVVMVKVQDLYKSIKLSNYIKLPAVFIISGLVGLMLPQVLCGGHSMVELLIYEKPSISFMLLLLCVKFIFGAVSFASSAPGGTLYPLCILGTYIGAIFGAVATNYLGFAPEFYEEFVVLGMVGFFSSIVRAPITGIVLVYELTGNMNNILPVATVSLISYAFANLLGSEPFYELLLSRLLSNSPEKIRFQKKNEKVLQEYIIPVGSPLDRKRIMDIEWGKHCLVVSIERDEVSITPKGETILKEGDAIVILVSQRYFSKDNARLERLIKGE